MRYVVVKMIFHVFQKTSNKYDDILIEKGLFNRLSYLPSLIFLYNSLNYVYFDNIFIDLAGGYNLKEIIPITKIKKKEDEFFLIKDIYTNTACTYLINKNLVKYLYKEYRESKSNSYFPIDHLINKLGLKVSITKPTFCIHFQNPLFTHGSFKGKIKSWQIY